jgi:hypothetical protein
VTTLYGIAVSSESFTFIDSPGQTLQMTDFSPKEGPSGTEVVITGQNPWSVSGVWFNGYSAMFEVRRDQIVAVVPPLASPGPITILSTEGRWVSPEPFKAFNSGEVGLTLDLPPTPMLWNGQATLSVSLDNRSGRTIDNLRLTNFFGSVTPASGVFVVSSNGSPVLVGVDLPDLGTLNANCTVGACMTKNAAVLWDVGSLAPGSTATLTVTATPRTSGPLHILAVATGDMSDTNSVYASQVTSTDITATNQLVIRHIDLEHIEITWPNAASTVKLQSAEAPLDAAGWSDVSDPIAQGGGHNKVVLPLGGNSRFYRLVSLKP